MDFSMARRKKCRDKGVLEYIAPKSRKDVKRLIRELGLEFVSAEMVEPKTGGKLIQS